MKKIIIIGDSHTAKLAYNVPNYFVNDDLEKEYTFSQSKESTYFKKNNYMDKRVVETNFYETEKLKIFFSMNFGRSAYEFDYSSSIYDEWNSEDSIVMPWLGYIDIRNYLPRINEGMDSVDSVVHSYVKKTIKKFNKSKIIFIEPMPQFVCYIINGWVNPLSDPDIEFEDRYECHLNFCESLNKYCKMYNLENPINSRKIYEAEWIEPYRQPKYPLLQKLNDHLPISDYVPMLDYILKNY